MQRGYPSAEIPVIDIDKTGPFQPLREVLLPRKFANRVRQILIGRTASRNDRPDLRKYPMEVEVEGLLHDGNHRLRELQDHDDAAGLQHSSHFREALLRVLEITQPERDRDRVE